LSSIFVIGISGVGVGVLVLEVVDSSEFVLAVTSAIITVNVVGGGGDGVAVATGIDVVVGVCVSLTCTTNGSAATGVGACTIGSVSTRLFGGDFKIPSGPDSNGPAVMLEFFRRRRYRKPVGRNMCPLEPTVVNGLYASLLS
jgi:hypothetical protein